MPFVPGLRSEYSLVGRLVHFGRMLDKIRLQAHGRLPADYHGNLGIGFDARTCAFLGVSYDTVKQRTLAGGCDEEVLAWAHEHGGPRTDDQCAIWNRFMMKLGWRDERSAVLRERIATCGEHVAGKVIETFFDLNDYDEGRDPVANRSWELKEPRAIILMGVAGSGKTTLGRLLADALGWAFTDADDFHPPENKAKMAAGIGLTDEDRTPWLRALHNHLTAQLDSGWNTFLACSSLKEAYRRVLVQDPGRVKLVYLKAAPELIARRLAERGGHYAGPALLESQFAALEEPRFVLTLNASAPPEALVARIRATYGW